MSAKAPIDPRTGFEGTPCRYCMRYGDYEYGRNVKAATQWHHITYLPERKAPLCDTHHRHITQINTVASRILKRKLTPEERSIIYLVWVNRVLSARVPSKFNDFWLNGPEVPPHVKHLHPVLHSSETEETEAEQGA